MAFIADLYQRPIAEQQEKANEQHYEVPTAFLKLCTGPRMKYSSCMWPNERSSLADAEDAILSSYCVEARLGEGLRGVGKRNKDERVEVEGYAAGRPWEAMGGVGKEGEGLRILDLGCGWGSLGLFLAEVGLRRETESRRLRRSTTPWRKLLCCPTRALKRSTSTQRPKRGDTPM